MKKIINGRIYDTEKAKYLGGYSNISDSRDFRYYCEELYRKRNGEYFVYGEGGPMSKYSRATGANSWSGSEDIRPVTFEEARIWAEKHLSADDYQEVFGEIVEDDSKVTVSMSLPASLVERIRRECSAQSISMGAWIESHLQI